MNRKKWSDPVSRDVACRRAAGRSKFNLWRKREAELRRLHVADMLSELGTGRGVQTQIARRLCLDRGTICRDVAEIRNRRWDQWSPAQRLERRDRIVAQIYGVGRANNRCDVPSSNAQGRAQFAADNYVAQNIGRLTQTLLGSTTNRADHC